MCCLLHEFTNTCRFEALPVDGLEAIVMIMVVMKMQVVVTRTVVEGAYRADSEVPAKKPTIFRRIALQCGVKSEDFVTSQEFFHSKDGVLPLRGLLTTASPSFSVLPQRCWFGGRPTCSAHQRCTLNT